MCMYKNEKMNGYKDSNEYYFILFVELTIPYNQYELPSVTKKRNTLFLL